MILIVATDIDPHADAVIELLRGAGADFLRVDLEACHTRFQVRVDSRRDGHWGLVQRSSGRAAWSDEVSTVWWRRGSAALFQGPPTTAAAIDQIECRDAVRWLVESLPPELFPLGHPHAMRAAENKFQQLSVARRIGLKIPEFLFSNAPDEIVRFVEGKAFVVIKTLAQSIAVVDGEEVSFRAVRVASRAIASSLSEVGGSAVALVQEEVKRRRDIRAFVTKEWAVAVSIAVDDLPPGEVDWRPHTGECKHEVYDLPPDLVRQCQLFLSEMRLKAGHFDFALSEDGPVFFECNPNGQWMWLELMSGASISRRVADVLLAHKK